MKVVVYTLGCKVNGVESRSIIRRLEEKGAEVSDELGYADVYVLNTCAVTGLAERKCRQMISRFTCHNPNAKIYVTGCSSQRDASQYEKYGNVVSITGNADKLNISGTIMSDMMAVERVNISPITGEFEELTIPAHNRTRDFIKIQDGCNNFCSYCVIPFVRGRERSRGIESIVKEVEIAAERCKEIVLTGINVSAYGNDTGTTLTELITALGNVPVRKRLSSLECAVIDERFLEAMAASGFCDHFHLSLQSGSDSVLRNMNRHYTTSEYLDKVKLIRRFFPNAGITTDIITGFPNETDEDVTETMLFMRKAGFSDAHIFPYSERKGTKAAEMPQLPVELRRERAAKLTAVKNELKTEFLKKQIGKTLSVYAEKGGAGHSTNYVLVYTDAPAGSVSDIKIKNLYKKGVR